MRNPKDTATLPGFVLVTGGAGFIGSNLADRLASEGHQVVLYDAMVRPGVTRNVDWLRRRHPDRVQLVVGDMRDKAHLARLVASASAVFHFAAQVAVTSSLEDPISDFEVNLVGTVNLLECLRQVNTVPLVFASTNKVYGDLADVSLVLENERYLPANESLSRHGINETRQLDFHTPYGCSKGSADQYVLDYARSFGLPAAVLRMSCIYGPRQMGTEDQGWVAHFLISALDGRTITLYGDGRQVRDILYVDDAVDAYLSAWREIDRVQGRAFNLGGGPENAVSLLQLITEIGSLLGRRVDVVFDDWRQGDQRYFVSDTQLIGATLGVKAKVPWRAGIRRLLAWLEEDRNSAPVLAEVRA